MRQVGAAAGPRRAPGPPVHQQQRQPVRPGGRGQRGGRRAQQLGLARPPPRRRPAGAGPPRPGRPRAAPPARCPAPPAAPPARPTQRAVTFERGGQREIELVQQPRARPAAAPRVRRAAASASRSGASARRQSVRPRPPRPRPPPRRGGRPPRPLGERALRRPGGRSPARVPTSPRIRATAPPAPAAARPVSARHSGGCPTAGPAAASRSTASRSLVGARIAVHHQRARPGPVGAGRRVPPPAGPWPTRPSCLRISSGPRASAWSRSKAEQQPAVLAVPGAQVRQPVQPGPVLGALARRRGPVGAQQHHLQGGRRVQGAELGHHRRGPARQPGARAGQASAAGRPQVHGDRHGRSSGAVRGGQVGGAQAHGERVGVAGAALPQPGAGAERRDQTRPRVGPPSRRAAACSASRRASSRRPDRAGGPPGRRGRRAAAPRPLWRPATAARLFRAPPRPARLSPRRRPPLPAPSSGRGAGPRP